MKRNRRNIRLIAGAAALALVVAACGADEEDPAAPAPAPAPAPTPPTAAGEVTILHAFTGEEDTAGLRAMIDLFNVANPDIVVREEGTGDFESLARTRIGAGTPSDIILHPQPGLLGDFVSQGIVTPLDGLLDLDRLESELVGGLLDLATFGGQTYAVPMRLSVKSLVWYNPATFDAQGYTIPTTWAEMIDLSDEMVADGITPWCIGMESGDATGWVSTDWVEDILLRTIGGDEYDRWVEGDLAFASDEVQGAIEEYMVPIWTNDDYVFGGRAQITREAFGDSVGGILGDDPECGMHRQATFIEGFITDLDPGAEFGVDYDFFYLPPITPGDRPVLGAGDYAALYTDNPAAVTFMEFLATAESGEPWAARGGFLSPFAPVFDSSVYPTDSAVRASEILAEATAFRFDGSDLMPGDVGSTSRSGSFWSEMTSWVLQEKTLTEALTAIDELYASIR
jgi:alpha-glucoside transport system substrate-binding protein